MNDRVARTEINCGTEHYVVSTINRHPSAEDCGRYAETIVFKYDPDTKKLGSIVDMGEAPEFERGTHDAMVTKWSKP